MSQTLPNMLENTISKIREMVDVNSVVGDPITTADGVTIIPISKISVGVSGGRTIISATYSSQIAAVAHLPKRGLAKNSDAPMWLSGVNKKNISCPTESVIVHLLPIS